MTEKVTLDNDYERMIPEYHKNTLIFAEHITRYLSATQITKGKIVLDIASGSGYGSNILSKNARKVYGVDISQRAILYANENYKEKNIEFLVGSADTIPLDDSTVDVVVSFETIEHIENYEGFIKEIRRVLKENGVLIISTPNDVEFAEGNHFHVHEFTLEEFNILLGENFQFIDRYFQVTNKLVTLADESIFQSQGRIDVPLYNFSPTEASKFLYFYFVCSSKKIKNKIKPIAAIGDHYSDRDLINQQNTYAAKIKKSDELIRKLRAEVTSLKSLHTGTNDK